MPGRRRGEFIKVNGKIISNRQRDWPAAGPMFEAMADATARANANFLSIVCGNMADIVTDEGSGYKLRGARGNKVQLEGRSNVRSFLTSQRQVVVRGAVAGIPEGFWSIVEFGRQRRYLVYSKSSRSGQKRVSKSGKVRQEFLTLKQVQRRFNQNKSLADLKPVRTPYGPRQYAMPGPHGPIGKPWKMAMLRSQPLLEQDLVETAGAAMVRTFFRG